jgi:starch synthase
LQKLLGLHEDPDVPLLGLISRLTPQKGLDLLAFIFDELMEENVQVVLLGSGKEEIENQFLEFSHRYRSKASANIFFSPSLAKKIYAASDIFLMPSRFEPCGLGQLIAMRYGSVPVVRKTGGLADTVVPYNRFTGEGTGFAFQNFNAHELLFTIKDALYYYHNDVTAWKSIITQAMEADHSWKSSAKEYVRLYKELIAK